MRAKGLFLREKPQLQVSGLRFHQSARSILQISFETLTSTYHLSTRLSRFSDPTANHDAIELHISRLPLVSRGTLPIKGVRQCLLFGIPKILKASF